MRVFEVLNKAADLLEELGWCHGYYQDPDGRLCAAGATFRTAPNASVEADHVLLEYVSSQREVPWPSVESWNDTHGRTAEEVVEAMRAAALIEQSRVEAMHGEVEQWTPVNSNAV